VGVDGCSQCTAPAALSDSGMTAAVCTSCDSDKVPNRDGTGCVTCSVGDCKSCVMDNICEECNSGFSIDSSGTSCVSSGTTRSGLSTGAIAGISVAVVVVVGGLIGFLCRGKA
ncbi:DnaJ-type Zn finger domain protein, partial [Giardia duodenalis]